MNKKSKTLRIVIIVILSFLVFIILMDRFLEYDNRILKGYYKSEKYLDPFQFRGYINFYKYYYTSENDSCFQNYNLYEQVKPEDIEELKSFFNNFKKWMEVEERSSEYDFDISSIDENDFFIICTKEISGYKKFDYYNVYFYDTDSHILYEIYTC